jgi:hypothetical protein
MIQVKNLTKEFGRIDNGGGVLASESAWRALWR